MTKLDPDFLRLKDILNAINEIEQFLLKSSFDDRMAVMAVAYEIAIIGEACGKLSDDLRAKQNHIPWSDIIGMRHRIIHGYGKVSIPRLMEVTDKHLPQLKAQIEGIIEQYNMQS